MFSGEGSTRPLTTLQFPCRGQRTALLACWRVAPAQGFRGYPPLALSLLLLIGWMA